MSDKWYWILMLNLENAYTLNVGSQIQTKMYRLICNLPSDLCEDWLHSLTVLGRLFHWLWHHRGVGPALAYHQCCHLDVGLMLHRPVSLSGWCRVAGPGLCVNCSLHLYMQNIMISVKTIIIIIVIHDSPLSKHWLLCFKLSPALSTLWTQLCSGGKKGE